MGILNDAKASELDNKTIVNEFESHRGPHTSSLMLQLS